MDGEKTIASDKKNTSEKRSTKSPRVLLVDDDNDHLALLSRFLSRSGFVTFTCEDGDEAIAALEGMSLDIVVCDIQMPRLNGLSVLEWIKANRPTLKVIIMTAFNTYDLYQTAVSKGAAVFLEKPFDPKLLLEILKTPSHTVEPPFLEKKDEIRLACDEAREMGCDGEVVVRSGELTGRIFITQGALAFATHSTDPGLFKRVLEERCGVNKDDLKFAGELCKETGKNILDVLVDEEVVDREEMKKILFETIIKALQDMFFWTSPRAMFIPMPRAFDGTISFEIEQVMNTVSDQGNG